MATSLLALLSLGLDVRRAGLVGPHGSLVMRRHPLLAMLADLPTEQSSLAEMRAFVKERGLEIATSGKGRTKAVIYADIMASVGGAACPPAEEPIAPPPVQQIRSSTKETVKAEDKPNAQERTAAEQAARPPAPLSPVPSPPPSSPVPPPPAPPPSAMKSSTNPSAAAVTDAVRGAEVDPEKDEEIRRRFVEAALEAEEKMIAEAAERAARFPQEEAKLRGQVEAAQAAQAKAAKSLEERLKRLEGEIGGL
eukprot:scaffold25032_cov30-Tisochrysis_lutea.AAC.1